MKSWVSYLVWLAMSVTLAAQGPRMTIRGTQTVMEVDQAEVTVRIVGGVVETVMELRFRNPMEWMVEGEFMLPLPANATVSSYALEVNGDLREAVAVEKEPVWHAYKTVKPQLVDPGVAERQDGNVYRTVFSVPDNGTRSMRIGYVEKLAQGPGGCRYHLPLAYQGVLASFRCQIIGGGDAVLKLTGDTPISFKLDAGLQVAEAQSVMLAGGLEVLIAVPDGPQVFLEQAGEGDDLLFLISDYVPQNESVARPAPAEVRLFWDASESAADRDQAKTLALLDAWLKHLGNLEVELVLLRDQPEVAGRHAIRNGDWATLRNALAAVDYDGALALGSIASSKPDVDLLVYAGNGVATLGAMPAPPQRPLIFLQSGKSSAALHRAVWQSGGAEVDVAHVPVPDALKTLVTTTLRVISVAGDQLAEHLVDDEDLAPGHFRVIGKIKAPLQPSFIELAYGVGAEVRVRRKIPLPSEATTGTLIRRLVAQRVLRDMESQPVVDRDALIAHCKRHSLVSEVTSLIVFERFEDHVRHRVPPPEPQQLALYEQQLAREGSSLEELAPSWRIRLQRHADLFPGYESRLFPRLRQVAIWKRSIESVFQPEELDAEAFGVVAGWHDRARALLERGGRLKTSTEYAQWREEIDQLDKLGPALSTTRVKQPGQGKPLVVSVRGAVENPGIVRGNPGMTLLKAVEQAGGPLAIIDLTRIGLYRNSGKVLFNPRNKNFEDPVLAPGDMIVVEDMDGDFGPVDPFADRFQTAKDAPAQSQHDIWIPSNSGGESYGNNLGFRGGGDGRRAAAEPILLTDPTNARMPQLDDFRKQIIQGDSPYSAYRKLRAGRRLPALFHIEAARILFAKGHHELACRTLSTLVDRGRGGTEALLAHSFWLNEFGQIDQARALLAEIFDDQGGARLALARAELATDSQQAADILSSLLTRKRFSNHRYNRWVALVALTELNRLQPSTHPFGGEFSKDLDADLRITVISESTTCAVNTLSITEPTGETLSSGQSSTGGIVTSEDGVTEFILRRAVPGTYTVKCFAVSDTTLRIALHTDWGRPEQTSLRVTRFVTGSKEAQGVATLEFTFRPEN